MNRLEGGGGAGRAMLLHGRDEAAPDEGALDEAARDEAAAKPLSAVIYLLLFQVFNHI